MPVRSVIQFAFVAVALEGLALRRVHIARLTYKTNGMHASAIQPDLVASAGEPPYIMSGQ
jgi:hypothetical protein